MPKSSTVFNSKTGSEAAKKQKRGRTKRNVILDAIRDAAILEVKDDATRDDIEQAFYKHVAIRALNPDDASSAMLTKTIIERMLPPIKPSSERVYFEFDLTLPPAKKADQIIKAASKGNLPPDIAKIFIDVITSRMKIEEASEVKDKLEKLELFVRSGKYTGNS